MPPVKRTQSTRASTRAANTARAPSRPTAPQEQTANSAPTSSENAGMVNVNLEALTVTLSAAVQQAVRSALATASTSGKNIGSSIIPHNSPQNRSLDFPAQVASKITRYFFFPAPF